MATSINIRGHLAVFLVATLCITLAARAATPGELRIAAVSADPNDTTLLYVLFDNPIPKAGDVNLTSYWTVYAKYKKNAKSKQNSTVKLEVISVDTTPLSTSGSVVLKLGPHIPSSASSVDVTFVNSHSVTHFTAPHIWGSSQKLGGLTSCSGRGTCDIYLSGSYSASIGGTPLYSIDSFAGYMHAVAERHNYGELGFYGEVKEKSSAKLDPDSFLTYSVYQYAFPGTGWHGPFQLPIVNCRLAGVEFNKKGNDVNFVTSPVLTLPIRLSGKLSGPVRPGTVFPLLNLELGTEIVDVEKSVLAPTNEWHVRGLLGATFVAGIPLKRDLMYSIQITSSYQVRLPSAPEIYYDPKFAPIDPTTGKKGPTPPRLGTQPRHSIDTKITYNLVRWFGITFEYSYGSLPPAFVKTNNTFSIGLTFTLAQTSSARYSILRP